MKEAVRALDELATEMILNLDLIDDSMCALLVRLSRNVTTLRAMMSAVFRNRVARALANGEPEKDVFEHIAERVNPKLARPS